MSSQNGLPASWATARIGELGRLLSGGTPATGQPDYWDGSIPWITSADIDEGFNVTHRKAITPLGAEKSATNVVPAGTLLIVTRVGLGKVALAPYELAFSQDTQALAFSPDRLSGRYLLYSVGWAAAQFKYSGRGTTISGIPRKQLQDTTIPVPPLAEQHRIVAAIEEHFTRLDAAVAALRRAQANLKRYRASVLKAACEGRLVPTEADLAHAEGRAYEFPAALVGRIHAERNEAGPLKYQSRVWHAGEANTTLPKGWCWASAGDLCGFITKGTTPSAAKLSSRTGDVPFIKVYNLTDHGTLDFTVNPTFIPKAVHNGELARSKLLPGDILMNIVGPPLGKVSVVPDTFPEWNMNQAIAVFRPMPSMNRRFFSLCLRGEPVLSWAIRRAKATAGQFNLTLEICRELPIPVPPAAEQRRISEEAERRLSLADQLNETVERQLRRTQRLRQSILKLAFEGKLVPQDPSDGPSATLR